jgi:hypothetical protein
MIELAFGAGSVPCKQQHTMSMEIELARPATQAGTRHSGLPPRVRCSVLWSPSSPWQFFADDPHPKSITPIVGFGVSPSMCSRQVFHSLERKVERPPRRAMLQGKAAKPLTMSSAKGGCVR